MKKYWKNTKTNSLSLELITIEEFGGWQKLNKHTLKMAAHSMKFMYRNHKEVLHD